MKLLLATPLLLAALLPAWGQGAEEHVAPPAVHLPVFPAPEELHEQIHHLQQEIADMENNAAQLGELPEAEYNPDSPMPEPPPGQSAAVADGGLIFDNARSCLAYLGNVRLNDPRLQLRAAHRLFIRLPKNEAQEAQATPAAAPQPTPAPNKPAPAAAPAATPEPQPAAHLIVERAAVDAQTSRVLLEGRQAHPSITLTRGQDTMTLQPTPGGEPARVFSNTTGDVLIEGSSMVFTWHDAQGEAYRLDAETGPLLYHGPSATLCVRGKARLTSARGTMESDEQLCITFTPQAPTAKADPPFAAFTAVNFSEIKQAIASGHVVLTTPATPARPAGTARGDTLIYSAAESSCTLLGKCSLVYGGNTLRETTQEGILHMAENGSITLRDTAPLSGTYERPVNDEAEQRTTITGEWQSGPAVYYDAVTNRVTTHQGFRAADALARFSCTGLLQLTLLPREGALPPAPKPGLPRLIIAQQEGVRHVLAEGDVQLHSAASGKQPACDMEGHTLAADLNTGEATLTAAPQQRLHARYGDYDLTAVADTAENASVELNPAGDILARGSRLTAILPGEKGLTRITCRRMMQLLREQSQLTLGEDSRIHSPDGILTTRGTLHATLAPGNAPNRAPKNYPQLNYNYSGLSSAATPTGGTLRTPQVSMQCEGAISLELKPGLTSDNARQSIRSATARDRVALAGKDATGRMVRATGDRLDYDPATGNFILRGRRVTLADEYNIHTASGSGAAITIDPHNNVRITGARQTTAAHRIQHQLDQNKKK